MTFVLSRNIFVGILALSVFFAFSFVAEANHAWSKYHWDLSTADTEVSPLVLGDNFTTAAWKQSLSGASDGWNQSVLKNTVGAGTSNANCDPTAGKVEVCNASYGNTGWLGVAQIWVQRGRSGHIVAGVTKLNDTYFNTAKYNSQAWRDFVTCQEVGHTFGLGHQDETFGNTNLGSCMDYTNDPDGTAKGQLDNRSPNQHDYDQLVAIYEHLNGTSDGGSGDGSTTGPGNGNGKGKKNKEEIPGLANTPSAWGQAVSRDAQGNNSVYVRELGNGMTVITHVLWVDEGHDHD